MTIDKKYASLRLFNAVVVGERTNTSLDYMFNSARGIVIAPSAMHRVNDIKKYVNDRQLSGEELNATFYSNWEKVRTVSLEQRMRDQITHYFSTYGLEALGLDSPDYIYLPNPGVKDIPDNLQVLVIKGVRKEDLQAACFKMLASGVALKQETIEDILYVLEYDCGYKFNGTEVIKNREAQVLVYDKTGVFPRDSESVLRYLVYKATGETLVIKNKYMIDKIRCSGYELPMQLNVRELAKTFNRYKPLWLAFKKANRKNANTINRIAKLSKTLHTPMKVNVLTNITSLLPSVEDVKKACENANGFQVARALNVVRLYKANNTSRMYSVRNGKLFVKAAEGKTFNTNKYEVPLISALQGKTSEKTYYIPDELDYALPVSEKMFSGNVPTGSSILAPIGAEHLLVGIYWEDEGYGSRTDLDLSAVNLKQKIGWNSAWRTGGSELMYSGDVTSGHGGAAEYMYMNNGLKDSYMLTVNLYSGTVGKPFKVIVGYGSLKSGGYNSNSNSNYVIDPNKVIFQADCVMRKRQMMIGTIEPVPQIGADPTVKFTLLDRAVQNSRVTPSGQNTETLALDYMLSANATSLRLRDFVKTVDSPLLADVDLSMQSLTRDSVLSIFE
ncbi:conserved hypothetical protein [Synechococcus phage S-CRM01]|uniref:hypothetical protein n=1 Tax=Synechococcus phage S-CRM01 TaxID=1026955 RepID=UPI000209E3FF|nr:hypothetical protein SCRM01_174 [Synechococcus phage S-CRM01]AEC53120.1 conserved hypothetical protein [Synechococcus phage S-CRM01]